MGSTPFGANNSWYAVLPSTATFFRYCTSVPLKNRPEKIGILVPVAKFSLLPKTTSGLVFRSR